MRKLVVAAALCGLMAGNPALARKPVQTGTPAQVSQLLACRTISDAAQRLACFDRETAGIDRAIASKNLVVVDREKANAAKRSLFGFAVPDFGGLFGGDDDEIKQVDSTITRVAHNPEGGWRLTLADGSVWAQTDDNIIALAPRNGDKVMVKRRALGSYTLSVKGQPGVKVKRVG